MFTSSTVTPRIRATSEAEASPISGLAFKKMISQIDPRPQADDLPAERTDATNSNGSQPKPKNEKRP